MTSDAPAAPTPVSGAPPVLAVSSIPPSAAIGCRSPRQHPAPGLHHIVPALFQERFLSLTLPPGSSSPARLSPRTGQPPLLSLPCLRPSVSPNDGDLTACHSALLMSPATFPGLTPSSGGEGRVQIGPLCFSATFQLCLPTPPAE